MKISCILIASLLAISVIFTSTDVFGQDEVGRRELVSGNNAFAIDLYEKLSKTDGNIFFSPSSISTALAMAYAGARGETADQMAKALHFTLSQERFHPFISELMNELEAGSETGEYELSIANALWGQEGYLFHQEFINITKKYYEAGFKEVDFKKNREEARFTINGWVEEKTKDKIKDLIKPDMLNELTRLVLTNAIYFKGKWVLQFKKNRTYNELFKLMSGEEIKVPTMTQTEKFMYAEDDDIQALEMDYKGGRLAMVVLLPRKKDGIGKLEGLLSADKFDGWIAKMQREEVYVLLPKFKMTSEFELSSVLVSLGMKDAFNVKDADFSGMTPDPLGLFISAVVHKAFVDTAEEGTEAAAATAVVMMTSAARPPKPRPIFRADHPFIFIIRDIKSGSILFMGRVADPRI